MLWVVVPFLPAAHILATGAFVVAERLLYMPSMGVCLACGYLWTCTAKPHRWRWLVVGLSLAAARTLSRSRAWRSEEALFEAAIHAYPKSSKAHFAYGNAVRFAGRSNDSISSYREAARIYPQHSDAYLNWGIALSNVGQRAEESLSMLHFALRLDPKAVDAYEQMATIFFNHAEPGKAVKALELAEQISPSLSFHALNVKGAAQLTLGDSKGAKDSFAESAGKRNHPETYNNWGILLQREGDHAGAMGRFAVAGQLRPTFAQPSFNTGVSLVSLKRLEEAVAQFGRAIELDAGYARAHANQAQALQQLGRAGEAKEHLQRALLLEPGSEEAIQIARAMGYRVEATRAAAAPGG